MKPVSTFEGTVEGSLEGYEIRMTLDENAMEHIVSVLTDLYSDSEMAIIREYSTNALDSHIAAGITDPIEVSTPTALDPYFIVKDHGVGLSVDEIENVYSKYGASTKRGTDDQIGMLGLGGKSALTYTSQFIVTARKNGVKAQVVVRRNEDGVGVMEVVDTVSTDERNGVEIKIPAKYGSDLDEKARNFFKFWEPGTVLLNGAPPVHILEGSLKINDNIYVVNGQPHDTIVMGNVAYSVEGNDLVEAMTGRQNGWYGYTSRRIVAFVEMGEVIFPPSREGLSYTTRTKTTIARLCKEIKDGIEQKIRDDVANADSHAEAFQIFQKWSNTTNHTPKDATYQGQQIPEHFSCGTIVRFYPNRKNSRYTSEVYRNASQKIPASDIINMSGVAENSIVVTGYSKADVPTATEKNKIRAFMDSEGYHGYNDTIWLLESMPGAPWTDHFDVVDWEDIRKIKLNSSAIKSLNGSRPIKIWDAKKGYWTPLTDLDTNHPIVYMSSNEDDFAGNQAVAAAVQHNPNAQILVLGKNRWNKLEREFPTAQHFRTFARNISKEAWDAVPADQRRLRFSGSTMEVDTYNCLKGRKDEIKDPEVVETIETLALDKTALDKYNRIAARFGRAREEYADNNVYKIPSLDDKYPLIPSPWTIRKHMDHVISYMNAIYDESKEK